MNFITKNIQGLKEVYTSPWRKISIGTWRITGDSSVFGMIEIKVGPVLKYLEKLNHKKTTKLSITDYLARALALTFRNHSEKRAKSRWICPLLPATISKSIKYYMEYPVLL